MREYGQTFMVALLLGILGFLISKSVLNHHQAQAVHENPAATAPADTRTQLAWMRTTLGLSEEEFARECALHDAHRAEYHRLHVQMTAARDRLRSVLQTTPDQTPEALTAIRDYEQHLAACEHAAILHVQKVAAAMHPAARQKYLRLMLPHLFHEPRPPSLLPAGTTLLPSP